MENVVKIHFPEEHPFIMMGVASYNMIHGINMIFKWDFDHPVVNFDSMGLFKAALGNIHRLPQKYQDSFHPSSVSIPEQKIKMICCCFGIKNGKKTVFYCFGMFIDLNESDIDPFSFSAISSRCAEITMMVKSQILNERSFHDISIHIQRLSKEINRILNAGIAIPNSINTAKLPHETMLAIALKSHISTQMVTIIEAPTQKKAKPLFDFLSHFLLPTQMNLSSNELFDEPVPGFFLQTVRPQGSVGLPMLKLLRFKRPWTWIRLTEETIYASPEIDIQRKYYNAYNTFINTTPATHGAESYNRIKKYLETYKPHFPKPSEWSTEFAHKLLSLPPTIAHIYCNQKMTEFLNKSTLLIEIVQTMLSEGHKGYLHQSQITEAAEYIDADEDDLLPQVVALADIFDRTIFQKVYSGKKEILRSMIVTI